MPFKPGDPRPTNAGRKKGSPNHTTLAIRERIQAEGDPLGLLLAIVRGDGIPGIVDGAPGIINPDLKSRISAAKVLLHKVAPDMKAIEVTREEDTRAVEELTESELIAILTQHKAKSAPLGELVDEPLALEEGAGGLPPDSHLNR